MPSRRYQFRGQPYTMPEEIQSVKHAPTAIAEEALPAPAPIPLPNEHEEEEHSKEVKTYKRYKGPPRLPNIFGHSENNTLDRLLGGLEPDDIILLGLIFLLINEEVKDEFLLIALVFILLT